MIHDLPIDGFRSTQDGPADYISEDGKVIIEVKETSPGVRGIHQGAMELAIHLEKTPPVERAFLVLAETRMSPSRLIEAWHSVKQILRGDIASKLSLISLDGKGWVDPDEPHGRWLAQQFSQRSAAARRTWITIAGNKQLELEKILLGRWLRRQGPIPIGVLCSQAGCSRPTAKSTLARLLAQKHLEQTSNRSIELRSFPHEVWRRLIALSPSTRGSIRFRDQSGERPSPLGLRNRLERIAPPSVAIGGVLAARRWNPGFDLNGTPRLDLVLHAPDGRVDIDFVRKVDPALARVNDPGATPHLVVHPLVRAESLFEPVEGGLPFADPVETALDLCDLELNSEANRLMTNLRPEVRLT